MVEVSGAISVRSSTDDGPFQGFFLEEGGPKIRQIFSHRIQVEASAGYILGPRVIAPFHDNGFASFLGQGISGGQTGQAGAHDDDFKFLQGNP